MALHTHHLGHLLVYYFLHQYGCFVERTADIAKAKPETESRRHALRIHQQLKDSNLGRFSLEYEHSHTKSYFITERITIQACTRGKSRATLKGFPLDFWNFL